MTTRFFIGDIVSYTTANKEIRKGEIVSIKRPYYRGQHTIYTIIENIIIDGKRVITELLDEDMEMITPCEY